MRRENAYRLALLFIVLYFVGFILLLLYPSYGIGQYYYDYIENENGIFDRNYNPFLSLMMDIGRIYDVILSKILLLFLFTVAIFIYRLEVKISLRLLSITILLNGFYLIYLFYTFFFFSSYFQLLISTSYGYILIFLLNLIFLIILFRARSTKNIENKKLIKKAILDLSVKFTKLEVKEIAEKCSFDKDLIVDVINEMITKHEIYGQFFNKSKSLVFDQQANIDEIDNLLQKYQDWETNLNLDTNKMW